MPASGRLVLFIRLIDGLNHLLVVPTHLYDLNSIISAGQRLLRRHMLNVKLHLMCLRRKLRRCSDQPGRGHVRARLDYLGGFRLLLRLWDQRVGSLLDDCYIFCRF